MQEPVTLLTYWIATLCPSSSVGFESCRNHRSITFSNERLCLEGDPVISGDRQAVQDKVWG